ncbi:MAG: hypothetical protein KKE30_01170 [Gammaproteobacteria bacterium]|nr:hypothetical protein [Gammaproteobacteria bacterium]MBU1553577.1 hypothetical protein [Gammaproteobacteria bacterium]MBU2070599.1 hypothetical protein [Gammaproteobacteria bacterium]MBU2181979.1 hypothetical protein [Gammaproteobacteria bacterium]MBU2207105.1 hypothetical protein [Gammaproteobacteria bacterium]
MTKPARLAACGWLVLVLCLLAYLMLQLPQRQWSSSITALLPAAAEPWQQQLLSQVNSSRQLTLKLSGLPLPQLRDAATALLQHNISGLSWYQPGAMLTQLQQQYQQHQSLLLSAQASDLLQQGRYQPLVDAAWQRLYSPAPLLSNALSQDPLLLTQQFMEQQSAGSLTLQQHWFETRQGDAIVLYGETAADPFDRVPASALQQALQQQLATLGNQWPALQIARSGVLFHAVHAADNASFEMQFYGSMSLLAILLLLVLSFRSARPLLLASLVLLPAVIAGLAALLLAFEQPHVLALVFATTLIGIAIDYSFHGMLAANQGKAAFSAMLPSLALGLVTTLLGYLALLWLPFGLLQQVALFMLAGLLAAFISVWLLLPLLLAPQQLRNSQWLQQGCRRINQGYQGLPAKPIWLAGLGISAVMLALLLLQGRFTDDVRLFSQSPASLLQQEAEVRTLGAQQWDSRFLVILADSPQQALQQEQALQAQLAQWQQQGWFLQWQGLSQQLASQQLQALHQQLLQQAYQSAPVQAYLTQLQLAVPAVRSDYLTPANFSSPLLKQHFSIGRQTAAVVLLRDVSAADLLQQAVAQLPAVYLLDPIADTNSSLQHLRAQLLIWLALALLLSIVVLSWRRGIQAALASALLLTLAIGAALCFSLWRQQQLNVFNLVAAILVLALALDYAVFYTSTLRKTEVLQAVTLSAATSCMAFGMLSFSQTPAVASFGFTVFSGVALSALLAPLLTLLSHKESGSGGTL